MTRPAALPTALLLAAALLAAPGPTLAQARMNEQLAPGTAPPPVVAPEDWILPDRTLRAARSPVGYMARLRAAEAEMKDEQAWLFSWGYHALWHGKLDRKAPSSRSSCR